MRATAAERAAQGWHTNVPALILKARKMTMTSPHIAASSLLEVRRCPDSEMRSGGSEQQRITTQ